MQAVRQARQAMGACVVATRITRKNLPPLQDSMGTDNAYTFLRHRVEFTSLRTIKRTSKASAVVALHHTPQTACPSRLLV